MSNKDHSPYVAQDGSVAYDENSYWNKKAYIERKRQPCQDCGLVWHPVCMTLDHPNRRNKYTNSNGKKMSPSAMLTYSQLDFKNMINSLDPVCSNCHKIRETKRDKTIQRPVWEQFTERLYGRGGILLDSRGILL